MALLTDITARIAATLNGSYPSSATSPNRQITPGTFAPGAIFMPAENAKFPKAAVATRERQYDLVWDALEYAAPDPLGENSYQGPHVRRARFTLRMVYTVTQPNQLTPAAAELVLGGLSVATRKALEDAAVIEWCWMHPPTWSSVALGWKRTGPATAVKVNALQVHMLLPGELLFSQSATTMPGLT